MPTIDPAASAVPAGGPDEYVYPDDCLACPVGCKTCSRDETCCECYEHPHPDDLQETSDE